MATPTADTFSAADGTTIYGGRVAAAASALTLTLPSTGATGAVVSGGLVANTGGASAQWSLAASPAATISPASGVLAAGDSVPFTLTGATAGAYSVGLTNVTGGSVAGSPATITLSTTTPTGGYFSAVTQVSDDGNGPTTAAGQVLVIELHGSGTDYVFPGKRYEATLAGGLEYSDDTVFKFSVANFGTGKSAGAPTTGVRPWDRAGDYSSGSRRESFWMGYTDTPGAALNLLTIRRLDRMMAWVEANVPNLSATKRYLTGGSMGGWGTMTYGLRRPDKFAAIYPDRPRWRSATVTDTQAVPSWTTTPVPTYPLTSTPALSAVDGGSSSRDLQDHIAYISNPANEIPYIAWCVGKADGYMPFQDHIDAVAALRATGRGFMFFWNSLGHSGGSRTLYEIWPVHPFGTFELGKGYPVFSEHSLDEDPVTAAEGGINLGLQFRNVVESAGAWSCEVRQISTTFRVGQACTVKVKPKSWIYTGNPSPQLVTIPAANTWVSVTF